MSKTKINKLNNNLATSNRVENSRRSAYLSPITASALFILLFTSSCGGKVNDKLDINTNNSHSFQLVDSANSNIKFSNTIIPDVSSMANLFDYDYFYNGAGVGIADINNDGLEDVFFCGNQVENKLFLNQGNMVFKDISSSAGINVNKNWATGVTFADINNDGHIDIYVSQGGPFQDVKRKNLLYINNMDLTFTESAVEYGLADKGITTQAAFADFDLDGDLDCIVMNEAELFGYDIIPFYEKVNYNDATKHYNTSHLYENIDGKYHNITPKSALDQPTFGLGLIVSDFNEDNLPDIYIANDYYIPDALYINKGDLNFVDEIKGKMNQVSFFGMGMDVADINNDNKEDILVLDMAAKDHYRSKTLMASMNTSFFDLLTNKIGFVHQYMYNSLQLNDGTGSYNNIAQLAGIESTDWSWTGLIEDLDNDGLRDIYITNGYRKYALDNDFKNKVDNEKRKYKGNIPLEEKQKLYDLIPEEKLANILYRNSGQLTFSDVTKSSNLDKKSYSNGAAIADLDNDGDLDIVVNNIDQNAFLIENHSEQKNWIQVEAKSDISEAFPKITIIYANQSQYHEIKRTRGYMSSSSSRAHFGLGAHTKIDTLLVKWNDGSTDLRTDLDVNQLVLVEKSDKNQPIIRNNNQNIFTKRSLGELKLSYSHQEDDFDDFIKETLLPNKQSSDGPAIKKIDYNNDGKDDLFVGSANGYTSKIFIQEDNRFSQIKLPSNQDIYEDTDIVLADINNDGNREMIITSGGNSHTQDKYFQNRILKKDNGGFESKFTPEANIGVSSKVISHDFDQDGYEDIIIANRILPQKYPIHQTSIYLENQKGYLVNNTSNILPELAEIGIVNDIIDTDINNDGWQDIIAVGEWTGIHIFINNKGSFEPHSQEELSSKIGWWYKVHEIDINNDGYQDYIVGNLGKNSKYKASVEKPLKIFANDFDDNGSIDIVLSKKYKDNYVPFRGRECSSQQMPFITEKYPTYDLFAKATIEDVYGNLDEVYSRSATEFKSIALINDGKGNFKAIPLPNIAQALPIIDLISHDFDKDGSDDALAIGNIYDTEVETPRMDFNSGIIISMDKNGKLMAKPAYNYGMKLNGNAKSIEKLTVNDKTFIVVGINNNPLNLFEVR